MNTEKVTARRLTSDEVAELGLQEEIFVSAELDDLSLDCFAPAFLTKPGKYFDGGSFIARTIFGKEIHVLPDNSEERGIWVADEAGEEIEVLQSAACPPEPRALRAQREQGISGVALHRREGSVRRGNRPALERGSRGGAGRQGRPVRRATRGRKNTSGQNRDRRALDIYPTRVRFMEPSTGWKFIVEPHHEPIDDTPTI